MNATTQLTARHQIAGWPTSTTVGELIALAKKRLGTRYIGVVVATYATGKQVEVRSRHDGYHGRQMRREQCYDIVS